MVFRATGFFVLACGLFGASCSVLFPGNDAPAAPTTTWTVHAVRVNTVGYVTLREKVATVVQPAGSPDLSGTTAEIFDMNNVPQWSCVLGARATNPDSGADTYAADFTGFEVQGISICRSPAWAPTPPPSRSPSRSRTTCSATRSPAR